MLNRQTAPAFAAIALPAVPHFEEVSMSGVPVLVVNQGDQPVIQLDIEIPLGRLNEPVVGLSFYLAKMLTEGTPKKTASEIAAAFDFYGSHLEVVPTLDGVTVRLFTLSRFLEPLLDLLRELMMESAFPEKEFETIKQIRIQQIRQQMARNNAYASLKFREKLFGENHPYGHIVTGEQAAAIGVDQLRAHGALLRQQPKVFVAGQIHAEHLRLVESMLASMTFVEPVPSVLPALNAEKSERMERPGSTQASIRWGQLTLSKMHPQYHQFKIANELFGGFFGSRLMKNIREEKGLTYGIHSGVTHLAKASYWTVSTEVMKDKVDLAMAEITRELESLQQNPPEAEEFVTAINYMKGKLLSTFDTPFSTLQALKNMKMDGLDPHHFESLKEVLDRITPQELSDVLHRHLDTSKMLELTVV